LWQRANANVSATSIYLRAAGDTQHEVGENDGAMEREKAKRSRRRAGHCPESREQRPGKAVRGVEWAIRGEDIDYGHVRERKNKAEQYGGARNRTHHGDDNLKLGAPETSYVNGLTLNPQGGEPRALAGTEVREN
jgi:hypothetical protein